jgi:hypothetical protein
MDIYCPRCGEPWDIDSLHEETDHRQGSGEEISFNGVRRDFSRRGCLALTGYGVSEVDCRRDTGNARAMASSALMGILGDDIDGVAALMDDAHALGMFR